MATSHVTLRLQFLDYAAANAEASSQNGGGLRCAASTQAATASGSVSLWTSRSGR